MILHVWWALQNLASAEELAQELHAVEVPLKLVLVQSANFAILIGLLVYFFRDKARAHFHQRRQSYSELVNRAEAAKAEATRKLRDLEDKLNKLQTMHAENIRAAEAESARVRQELIAAAQATSKRLETDARQTAATEIEKAKNNLRVELLKMAVETASNTLKTQVGEPERKKLQNDFAQKLEVLRG